MKLHLMSAAMSAGLLMSIGVYAQAPAAATQGSEKPVATAPATAGSPATAPKKASAAARNRGEGLSQVLVNTKTKVYQCIGPDWDGKAKHDGEYMSEADAKAAGYHADKGKGCS